jgi:hypothetical protein
LNSRRQTVQVLPPVGCNLRGNQVFCSRLSSNNDETCRARTGSPIFCGAGTGNPNIVAGIVISQRICSNNLLHYHTLQEPFGEWINQVVTGAATSTKYSLVLILSIVLINIQKFL